MRCLWWVLAVLVVLNLGLVGCGGDDDDNDSASPDDDVDDDSDDDVDDDVDDDADDDAGDDDTWPPLPDDDSADDDADDDIDDDTVPVDCEAAITRQPYLQLATQNSIRVLWRTDAPGYSRVEWADDRAAQGLLDNHLKKHHNMEITGLDPGTEYPYFIESCGEQSESAHFRTAPMAGDPFTFVVLGDTQDHPEVHTEVAAAALDYDPDMAIHVGDLVGSGWQYGDYDNEFFTPAQGLLQNTPMFPSMGNHDANSIYYFNSFHLPGSWSHYSYTYSNVFFIALNTTWLYYPGSTQYRWFIDQLESDEAQNADWIVVYGHHPPYSEGWEGYDGEPMMRAFMVPLFEEYGVDFYFSGHTHDYERGQLNGVNYIISGGGGGTLDPWARDYPHVTVWQGIHHFTGVNVNGLQLTLQGVDVDGNVFDEFSIDKTP